MNLEDIYNIRKDTGVDKMALIEIYNTWTNDFQINEIERHLKQQKRAMRNCPVTYPELDEEHLVLSMFLEMIYGAMNHLWFGDDKL